MEIVNRNYTVIATIEFRDAVAIPGSLRFRYTAQPLNERVFVKMLTDNENEKHIYMELS